MNKNTNQCQSIKKVKKIQEKFNETRISVQSTQFLFNLVYIVKVRPQKWRDFIIMTRTRIDQTTPISFDDSSSFRMKRVIVERHYPSISTKKDRSIRQKFPETSKMCFSYSIKQFTTLKNFYPFLINAEKTEMKQFVSTINVLKL